jgi:FkbM family methyltransferase
VTTALGDDSRVVRPLRPLYESVLRWTSGSRGIAQTVNGRETFRIDPRYRVHFPDTYEPDVCEFLRSHVRPRAVTLNVGAHVGVYALCLARWSAPGGQVFAFEPNPLTRRILEEHVKLNERDGDIRVIPCAVSDRRGQAVFFAGTPGLRGTSGLSRLGSPNPDIDRASAAPVTVDVTTIDVFCADRNVTPQWLVVDVEGYELAVLKGARSVIDRTRGALGIVVEMHPNLWMSAGASRGDFEQFCTEARLTPVALTGQKDPFAEYGVVAMEYAERG